MIRAVVDPNVFVSARISSLGHPARIARATEEGAFGLVVSESLLRELEEVLLREKFRRYVTVREVIDFVAALREKGTVVSEGEVAAVSPDPKDDYLVALARTSRADYLVSGDPHLRGLRESEDLPRVLTPRAFVELLRSECRTR